jgi:hypothetical protein
MHLTPADYLESQLLHLRPARWASLVLGLFAAFWGCALVYGLYLSARGQFSAFLLAPGIIFGAVILGVRYVLMPLQIQRLFAQQKDLNEPYEVEVTETGLTITNAFGHSQRPWSNFAKWKENQNLVLLYYSDVMYTLLPKRIFADPQQVDFVRAKLRENNVPTAGRSRPRMVLLFVILVVVICVLLFQFRTATP